MALREPRVNSQKASVLPIMSMLGRLVARMSRMISSPMNSSAATVEARACATSGRYPSPSTVKEPSSYLARMYDSSSAVVHVAWSAFTPALRLASRRA